MRIPVKTDMLWRASLGMVAVLAIFALPLRARAQEGPLIQPMIGETAAEFVARLQAVRTRSSNNSDPAQAPQLAPSALVPFVGETAAEFEARRSGGSPSHNSPLPTKPREMYPTRLGSKPSSGKEL